MYEITFGTCMHGQGGYSETAGVILKLFIQLTFSIVSAQPRFCEVSLKWPMQIIVAFSNIASFKQILDNRETPRAYRGVRNGCNLGMKTKGGLIPELLIGRLV